MAASVYSLRGHAAAVNTHWPIDKQPCRHSRIVDEKDLPPYGVEHSILDFPEYYTPLWNPGWFREVFSNKALFCKWLEEEFCRVSPGWIVEIGIEEVIVTSRLGFCAPFSLSFAEVEDAAFYPPTIIRRVGEDTPERSNYSLRYFNPSWLFYSHVHRYHSMQSLHTTELMNIAYRIGCVKPGMSSRHDFVCRILDCVREFSEEVAQLTDESLRTMCYLLSDMNSDPGMINSVLQSRRTMFSYLFERHYGKEFACLLRTPCSFVYAAAGSSVAADETLHALFGNVTSTSQITVVRRMSYASLTAVVRRIHPSRRESDGVGDIQLDSASIIVRSLRNRCAEIHAMSNVALRETLLCLDPYFQCDPALSRQDYALEVIRHEYGRAVTDSMLDARRYSAEKTRLLRSMRSVKHDRDDPNLPLGDIQDETWPNVVSDDVVHACLKDYVDGMKWEEPPVCACCARSTRGIEYSAVDSRDPSFRTLKLDTLAVYNAELSQVIREGADDSFWDITELDNLLLEKKGIERGEDGSVVLCFCQECRSALHSGKMPRLALANNLYRGRLPSEFEDITWVEEMVCAKHLSTALVTKLSQGHSGHHSRKLRGNTCAHEMNILSTVNKLPRAPVDVNDMLSVVFVGDCIPEGSKLQEIFFVRREKVWKFLLWLKDHNELYANMVLDYEVMTLYPERGVLPGLTERIILNKVDETVVQDIHDQETAGLDAHPSEALYGEDATDGDDLFLEKTGVSDAELTGLPGRVTVASGLRKLIPRNSMGKASMEIHRGAVLPEYGNPRLLPGMYPTLFPYGIGGFDDRERVTGVGFEGQAEYCLDLADRRFRYHQSFIFVVLNIIQRRKGHLYTSFTVSKGSFNQVADSLNGLSVETIERLARTIETEGRPKDLSEEEKTAMLALRYVNTIATKVPGSAASKTLSRNEIRSYVGVMGVPHIFLTINPVPQHHPLFQLMYGDHTVNLNERYPQLVPGAERAKRLAHDPVAAADFFDKSIRCIFEHLFGWDYKKSQSSDRGGILGRLEGFYGTAEYTERGVLHGHFLLWLRGGLNPSEVHRRMKDDKEFEARFFSFFEDIIKHDLPNVEVPSDFNPRSYRPATELPPAPLLAEDASLDDLERMVRQWDTVFETEIKLCGESLQRHPDKCRPVCRKYGSEKCRFRFPHEVIEASRFDSESNSVFLACRDPMVNYYNPYILVYCRHNHDIRCILSGKSAKSAMFYITDYITKMSMKTGQMLSLMCKAVLAAPQGSDKTAMARAKKLLHKCLAQFSRKQQIHAQQAARYLRRLDDSMSSHKTVPMLSHLVYNFVCAKYRGRLSDSDVNRTVSGNDATEHIEQASQISDEDVPAEEGRAIHVLDEQVEDDTEILHLAGRGNQTARPSSDSNDLEATRIVMDIADDGRLVHASQLHDYLFRDDRLFDMSFIDFVCMYKREKGKLAEQPKSARAKDRFGFKPEHPLANSHILVQRYEVEVTAVRKIYSIPRVIGMSIPRERQGDAYWVFLFSHFVPFNMEHDPLQAGQSIENFTRRYEFSDQDRTQINNWDVIYECEDARDAERLAAQEKEMLEMRKIYDATGQLDHDDDDGAYELGNESPGNLLERKAIEMNIIEKLQHAGYIDADNPKEVAPVDTSEVQDIEDGWITSRLKLWDKEIKVQEKRIVARRMNLLDPRNQSMLDTEVADSSDTVIGAPSSETGRGDRSSDDVDAVSGEGDNDSDSEPDSRAAEVGAERMRLPAKETVVNADHSGDTTYEDADSLMTAIRVKHNLNEKQFAAFSISAQAWLKVHIRRSEEQRRGSGTEPLVEGENGENDNETDAPEEEPLRLLMTGPGGTGKSHSIKALKEFMEHYGSGDRLRLLAPTGSAAALIDGMTCHKGLALRVKKKADDVRKVQRTSFNETYEMADSFTHKLEMRNAWKNVDVVLIDEVSLLSLQALSELDHALRMAKERYNEWFGGIIVIFSGDFCQYPPVCGTALYRCVRLSSKMNTSELKLRLGRLAWKTLNAVVEFEEQFRMKEDPEYGAAVGRLRLRQCTEEDVQLFNSRVIKSAEYPGGVDMSLADNTTATTIVKENDIRQKINLHKASSVCSRHDSPVLVRCAALDYIGNRLVPQTPHARCRSHVLGLRTAKHSADGALCGVLPLFVGMPVILRVRNIAVDLRIANGSQGFVHQIESGVDEYGFTYAKAALVYFPDSPVQLTGLPKGVFPIKPISWSFSAMLQLERGKVQSYKVKRYQLPIEPGYSVTGHSAQGKTLPKVQCNLRDGAWAAYVAASRARRREDIFLLQDVALKHLNKGHTAELLLEMERFSVMEHNTLIKYGFKEGTLLEVPDAEDRSFAPSSRRFVGTSSSLIWDALLVDENETVESTFGTTANIVSTEESLSVASQPDCDAVANSTMPGSDRSGIPPRSSPRVQCSLDTDRREPGPSTLAEEGLVDQCSLGASTPREQDVESSEGDSHLVGGQTRKRSASPVLDPRASSRRKMEVQSFQGCVWSSRNWSCAYDCVFVALACIYWLSTRTWKEAFRNSGVCMLMLSRKFEALAETVWPWRDAQALNRLRDDFRRYISAIDSKTFPRHGHVLVSVSDLLSIVLRSESVGPALAQKAGRLMSERSPYHRRRNALMQVLYDRGEDALLPAMEKHNHQCWLTAACTLDRQFVWPDGHGSNCSEVGSTPLVLQNPPPILLLYHNYTMRSSVLPVSDLYVPGSTEVCRYELRAIIYSGAQHFTARLVFPDAVYAYDSKLNDGLCVREAGYNAASLTEDDLETMCFLGESIAHCFLYVRYQSDL